MTEIPREVCNTLLYKFFEKNGDQEIVFSDPFGHWASACADLVTDFDFDGDFEWPAKR